MDTKFWGPSGWKLLHLITFAKAEPTHQEVADLKCFFSTLPYILPCKFCRKSLSEYMVKLPLEDALKGGGPYAIAKWLWKIHNSVNSKLREQKLLKESDPPFASVKKLYTAKFEAGCTRTNFEGWEFLFSVVENHPFSKQSIGGIPIKDAPDHIDPDDHLELNRWNKLQGNSPEILGAILDLSAESDAVYRVATGLVGAEDRLVISLYRYENSLGHSVRNGIVAGITESDGLLFPVQTTSTASERMRKIVQGPDL